MAIASCVALVSLTTYLHGTSLTVRNAVAGVKLAESAQIDLLMHERARDEVVRAELAARLMRRAREARQYVTSVEELRALDEADAQIERFVRASRSPEGPPEQLLERTYAALERVVNINVAQADAAIDNSMRWDALANTIGLTTGALMVIVLGTLLWWLRRAVVQPVLVLASAMERFGQGDLHVRTTEQGAAELRAMHRRFNAMADALARQHEARLTYLAGVAHDLRNPLAALQMSIAALSDRDTMPAEERVRQLYAIVERQVERLNRMVGDLLDAARIEAGQLTLEFEDRDLRALVREVAELFESASAAHTVRLQLGQHPIPVRCDAARVEQVLVNLLSNAIKYSPGGGDVEVSVQIEGGRAAIRVRDHGVGISPEDLERLWEPFRRANQPAQGGVPGAGLGLSIVRRIVKAHGGEVSVQSRPGAGSTFTVYLPLAEPRSGKSGAEADGAARGLSPFASR